MIRESIEMSRSKMHQSEIIGSSKIEPNELANEENSYEQLQEDVMRMLRKKKDK